jgi:hypothetical protein
MPAWAFEHTRILERGILPRILRKSWKLKPTNNLYCA